jgi:hypothetical protein
MLYVNTSTRQLDSRWRSRSYENLCATLSVSSNLLLGSKGSDAIIWFVLPSMVRLCTNAHSGLHATAWLRGTRNSVHVGYDHFYPPEPGRRRLWRWCQFDLKLVVLGAITIGVSCLRYRLHNQRAGYATDPTCTSRWSNLRTI